VDRALAKGEGDFVKDVAAELPLLAICELLGVPAADRGIIFDLSNRLIGFDDPEFRTSPDDAMEASMEMYVYADGIAAARRESPADDIATKLLQAEVDGGALTQEQFNVFFLLLSVAGNETTRNSITHGMQAFFDHPDQWEIFKKERPLETAVEEIGRRLAAEGVEVVVYCRAHKSPTRDHEYLGMERVVPSSCVTTSIVALPEMV